ncbi:hypothetical protein J8273_3277 [Carpediemonas membranifera]|uniref:Maestro/Maestro-like HEAT-repeats domain-containing protein n=1 Tax=Carpediemonas membranifera TaxID=201153 RepID=A0A8J6ASR3_9EUKA|nr:hypothetical protein J8273_3277 [Carpediemonas membranifera]|eukprot:KAG9393148.1 hypothetical protein J8273_3277 [Carpediemonas membranifera]
MDSVAAQVRALLLDTLDGNKVGEAERQLSQVAPLQFVEALVMLLSDGDLNVRRLVLVHLRRLLGNLSRKNWEGAELANEKDRMRPMIEKIMTFLVEVLNSGALDHVFAKPIAELYISCVNLAISIDGIESTILVNSVVTIMSVLEAMNATSAPITETALIVTAKLQYYFHHILSSNRGPEYHAGLIHALSSGVQHPDGDVRLNASLATQNIIETVEEEHVERYTVLIPPMASALGGFIGSGDEYRSREILNHMVELGSSQPLIYRSHAADVANMILQIITTPDVIQEIRSGAVELGVALCTSAPRMMREVPNFVQTFFPTLMTFMTELDDDIDGWLTTDDPDQMDEGFEQGSPIEMAETAVDSVAIAIGGQLLLPVLFDVLPQFSHNDDWKYRHAGIMTVGIVAEGMERVITPEHVEQLIGMIDAARKDPHPRVRWACMNSLGHMASDLPDIMHSPEFTGRVLEMFIQMVSNPEETDRVKAHAIAAISNFCLDSDAEVLKPFLPRILENLANMLGSARRLCRMQALSTVGDVAVCASDEFRAYYASFMPGLINVLTVSTAPEDAAIRARAITTITNIGLTAGRERFLADAQAVMAVLMQQSEQGLLVATGDGSDDITQYFHSGFSGLARALKEGFSDFVPKVMPQLLQTAVQSAQLTTTIPPGAEENDIIEIGGERYYSPSAIIDDIVSAMRAIGIIFRQCPAACMGYTEQAMSIAEEKSGYLHSDEARAEAATLVSAIGVVLCFVNKHTGQDVSAALKHCLDGIVEMFNDESMMEAIEAQISGLVRIVNKGHDLDVVKNALPMLCSVGEECNSLCRILLQEAQDVDRGELYDQADQAEQLEQVQEEVDSLVAEVAALYMALFEHFGTDVMQVKIPSGSKLKPNKRFHTYLDNHLKQWFAHSSNMQTSGLVVCSALIQYANTDKNALGHASNAIRFALEKVNDHTSKANLKQLAFSLLGLAATHLPRYVVDVCSDLINACLAQINTGAREAVVNDNAYNCIARIACSQELSSINGLFDRSQLLAGWFDALPLTKDDEEIAYANKLLLELVNNNEPAVVGTPQALAKVVELFVKAYGTSDTKPYDPELSAGMRAVLFQCQQSQDGQAALTEASQKLRQLGAPYDTKLEGILSG